MADITNLNIHTGLTKKLRCQEAAPTSTEYPEMTSGEIYIDSTDGSEAICVRNGTSWLFINMATV